MKLVEKRLGRIFAIVEHIEEERLDEMARAGELAPWSAGPSAAAGADCVAATVAAALFASTPSAPAENLVKPTSKNQNKPKRRES